MGQVSESSDLIGAQDEILFLLHLSWTKGGNPPRLSHLAFHAGTVLELDVFWGLWPNPHGQDPVPCLATFKASCIGTIVGIA